MEEASFREESRVHGWVKDSLSEEQDPISSSQVSRCSDDPSRELLYLLVLKWPKLKSLPFAKERYMEKIHFFDQGFLNNDSSPPLESIFP